MEIDLKSVLLRIQELCQAQGVKYLVSRNLANILYLTGFSVHATGDAVILVTPSKIILFSDRRYEGTLKRIADRNPLVQLFLWDRNTPQTKTIVKFVRKGAVLGFEAESEFSPHMFVKKLKAAARKRGVQTKGTKDIIETIRSVKTPAEIAVLKKAFEISDQAFEFILEKLKPGRTELEISRELGEFLRRASGCEDLSFPTLVARGANAATPHPVPGRRKLRKGDAVVLDFGCIYNGYHSDMTRTVMIGEPGSKLQEVYRIVLEAQTAAEEQARAGMTGRDLDKIALDIIVKAGYGKRFTHSLSHGVGLDIHELPWASPSKMGANILQAGMVFSIEPGIYLRGQFGVRIENVGVLTKSGFEPFSRITKELIILK